MNDALDIDNPATWPPELRGVIDRVLRDLPDWQHDLDNGSDPIDPDDRAYIEDLCAGTCIVVYHATRLLPHEIDAVTRDGLLPAGAKNAIRRIAAAVESGDLSEDSADILAEAAKRLAESDSRRGRVCVTTSSRSLAHRSAFWRLFTYWGGEATYISFENDPDWKARLTIGQPAVISAAVPLADDRIIHRNLNLTNALLHARTGQPGNGELHVNWIQPSEIVAVIRNGSPQWQALAPLSEP